MNIHDRITQMKAVGGHRRELSLAACQHLFDSGCLPESRSVRALTNQGSLTDIGQDIEAFWAEVRARMSVRISILPERLQDVGAKFLAQALGVAREEARNDLEEERALMERSAQDVREQAAARVGAAEEAAALARESLNSAQEALSQAVLEVDAGRRETSELRSCLADRQGALEDATARIQALERFLEEAGAALRQEKALAQEREANLLRQAALDKERLEGAHRFAIMQIEEHRKASEAAANAARQQIARLDQDLSLERRKTAAQANQINDALAAKARLEGVLEARNEECERLRSLLEAERGKSSSQPSCSRLDMAAQRFREALAVLPLGGEMLGLGAGVEPQERGEEVWCRLVSGDGPVTDFFRSARDMEIFLAAGADGVRASLD